MEHDIRETDITKLAGNILSSSKYSHLSDELVRRLCREEFLNHKNDKDRAKAVKKRLHGMYGAFFSGPDCYDKAERVLKDLSGDYAYNKAIDQEEIKAASARVLNLHASTRERIHHMGDMYRIIADAVGEIQSILDIGCGFHPFAVPWMPWGKILRYEAWDIDIRTVRLINRFFLTLGLPPAAEQLDAAVTVPSGRFDMVFLMKMIPVLESQKTGRGYQLIHELDAEYIIATFPLKSLGGREKGMETRYRAVFEERINTGGEIDIIHKERIHNEFLYILRKPPGLPQGRV